VRASPRLCVHKWLHTLVKRFSNHSNPRQNGAILLIFSVFFSGLCALFRVRIMNSQIACAPPESGENWILRQRKVQSSFCGAFWGGRSFSCALRPQPHFHVAVFESFDRRFEAEALRGPVLCLLHFDKCGCMGLFILTSTIALILASAERT
jgi:hypothetical protein